MAAAPRGAGSLSGELAVLTALAFQMPNAADVLAEASAAVPRLGPCRLEAAYRCVDDSWDRLSPSLDDQVDMDQLVTGCRGNGSVEIPGRAWAWAFPLMHRDIVQGTLVVSCPDRPSNNNIQLLMVLANQTGAALARVVLHSRDARCTEDLATATSELATVRRQLRNRSVVHETIEYALASGGGEQAITDALHELTGLAIALEDKFGNLRCWSGPGQPAHYPEPDPQRRLRQLAVLAARRGPMRIKDRVAVLLAPRGEQLGVLAIIDPRSLVTDDDIFALHFACTMLGYELSHQRNLVELEESVRRELFEDLLAGADDDAALARAEALGHDLRRPHYVIVAQSSGSADSLAAAAARAAAALNLPTLRGRRGQLTVLLAARRPDPRALHRTLSELVSPATCAIGIGSRCNTPSGIPQSFTEAQRALNVRLHSAAPVGASAFEDLGFYRLIDAAHTRGAVEDFVREWLGQLIDYDAAKKSELVLTLSKHLESGGNYDDSAKALHIHRSTLRYRLARIGELTGYDLRDVDIRFNLHAATRAWRFLHASPGHSDVE